MLAPAACRVQKLTGRGPGAAAPLPLAVPPVVPAPGAMAAAAAVAAPPSISAAVQAVMREPEAAAAAALQGGATAAQVMELGMAFLNAAQRAMPG